MLTQGHAHSEIPRTENESFGFGSGDEGTSSQKLALELNFLGQKIGKAVVEANHIRIDKEGDGLAVYDKICDVFRWLHELKLSPEKRDTLIRLKNAKRHCWTLESMLQQAVENNR